MSSEINNLITYTNKHLSNLGITECLVCNKVSRLQQLTALLERLGTLNHCTAGLNEIVHYHTMPALRSAVCDFHLTFVQHPHFADTRRASERSTRQGIVACMSQEETLGT